MGKSIHGNLMTVQVKREADILARVVFLLMFMNLLSHEIKDLASILTSS